MTIEGARTAAQKVAGAVAGGANPAEDKRAEKARARSILALVAAGYVDSLLQRRIVNVLTIESTLLRGLKPLMDRELSTLTRADFVGLIDAIAAGGKLGAAQDLRKHIRSMLEWAVSKGLVQFNVMAGLRMPKPSRAERLENGENGGGGKALSDSEIAGLWAAAGDFGAFGALMRLAVLSGLRRSELSGLKWDHITPDRIAIAAEHAKTGVSHTVPLTPAMRALLDRQPRTKSGYVFAGRGDTRMGGWSKLLPKARTACGFDFSLHDLRRTTRTLFSRLGVDEPTAELAIGHVRRGLVSTYNKDDGFVARRQAFEKVSDHVMALVR